MTDARSRMDDGFTRKEVTHHLTVLDPSFMTVESEHSYVLVAQRPSRFFQRRYEWTGSGDETTPEITSGIDGLGHRNHNLQGPVVRGEEKSDRLLVVDLGRMVPEKDSETVTIRHSFVVTEGKFDYKMAHRAYAGCRKITIKVSLPRGLNVSVEHEVRKVGAGKAHYREPLKGTPQVIDRLELERYEKVVTAPVRDEYYSIVWTVKPKRSK